MTFSGNHSIYIVDDDADDLELIGIALAEINPSFELNVFSDGEELLEFLKGEDLNPDLILLDLNMPKISGLEALRYIRGEDELKSIPVVILTTSKSEEDKRKCYAVGADGFYNKPSGFRDLVKVLKSILASVRLGQRFSTRGDPITSRIAGLDS